ncbi:MAG: hypothetical protein ACJA2C_002295 [Marinoscillum sp.]|jgi:hypothetical protein
MMKYNFAIITFVALLILINFNKSLAQAYWQQKVDYKIIVDFDDKKHQYKGIELLTYTNNSPDTLKNVFYHFYLNAFQPNSMMDMRSRILEDSDSRVENRISELGEDEIGYLKVINLSQDGKLLNHKVSETILEVKLASPIAPGASTQFEMNFKGQVPLQIRRTGRNSLEGIDYSMAQWYPKMAEYDKNGWHTSPYVAREFHAPWGDFDVKITIDRDYVLAGTGILQNPNEMGFGYEEEGITVPKKDKRVTWHFKAKNVHDFVWAADKEYTQTTAKVPNGPLVRFFYVPNEETELWKILPEYTVKAFEYIEKTFGPYGWEEYSLIQGGDGGMEYPMATLIANKKLSGVRSFESLINVMAHEVMHSWYQGMLATNESLYAWMDEGFTNYAQDRTVNYILESKDNNPQESAYRRYRSWVSQGKEEPSVVHADHFTSNAAYSRASYTKGTLVLTQLGYIIGEDIRDQALLSYYNKWSFKHPDMYDFINVVEGQSGLELSWFFEYWIQTTKTIDYAIESVKSDQKSTKVKLQKIGLMPMPLDIHITKNDGSQLIYYIPLGMMRGEKVQENETNRIIGKDWAWTHPTYEFSLDIPYSEIKTIHIDPSERMADIDLSNNTFVPSSIGY